MSLLSAALDILFPPLCLICRSSLPAQNKSAHACDPCLAAIPLFDTLRCAVCSGRLPENKPSCHPRAPYLLAAVAPYGNRGAHSLIWQLKYESRTSALKPIRLLLQQYLSQLSFDFTDYTLVPIPLHPTRERTRGFNQAEEIARLISELIHRPVVLALTKIRNIKPQAETHSSQERLENINGCFAVRNPELVAGKNIVLVDDVSTTGATLTEATKILKAAGAQRVLAFVILKT